MFQNRDFEVHLRCQNCVRPSMQIVTVPRVEGAPSTVDEFIESAAMTRMPFKCHHCEGTAGSVVAVILVGEADDVWEAPPVPFVA